MISQNQKEVLGELINIGFGRAASSLSILTGKRILMETPQVEVCLLRDLAQVLQLSLHTDVITIHQVFGGKLKGTAIFLLDTSNAALLVQLLNLPQKAMPAEELSEGECDALMETGNIVLAAFLSSFGGLLQIPVHFNVPSMVLGSLQKMLSSITVQGEEIKYGVVVKIHYRMTEGNVEGHIVIVMGLSSMETMIQAMETEGYVL